MRRKSSAQLRREALEASAAALASDRSADHREALSRLSEAADRIMEWMEARGRGYSATLEALGNLEIEHAARLRAKSRKRRNNSVPPRARP